MPAPRNPSPDEAFMERALELAREAEARGEVPVGAVVVFGNDVLGAGSNRPIASCDPTAHAEIEALRAAARAANNYRLPDATLYVTLEPCAMCIGAVFNARIARLVFGAWDPKAGACGSVVDLPRDRRLSNRLDVFGGVCAERSGTLLQAFFARRR